MTARAVTRKEVMFHIDQKTGHMTTTTETICRRGRKPWTVERIRAALDESPHVVFIPPPPLDLLKRVAKERGAKVNVIGSEKKQSEKGS